MGMSTHIIGFRPPDEKWQKMKKVWDACVEAGTDVPDEVSKFFNWDEPDEKGIEVSIPKQEFSELGRSGYDVEIAALPAGITHIRFYNSW